MPFLRRKNLILKQELKSFKQKTLVTLTVRLTLKTDKNLLKVGLVINTLGSTFYIH